MRYDRLIRTSVALALTCMYLMWFIIYMAQLHPIVSEYLIRPRFKVSPEDGIPLILIPTSLHHIAEPKRGDIRFLEH